MQVTYVPGNTVNSDLGVVNCARVSLHRQHDTFDADADSRLIAFLLKHNHWTPFAHARIYFELQWHHAEEQLAWYKHYNPAGFAHFDSGTRSYIKGSLYAWMNNLQYLSNAKADYIIDCLVQAYPVSAQRYSDKVPTFSHSGNILLLSEAYVHMQHMWKIATATVRVKVPIFIARQLRTSQVAFAYSDLYVEPESFVYNEVSRRYVNDEPEFYSVKQWRVREGSNVKQGSTGVADNDIAEDLYCAGIAVHIAGKSIYRRGTQASVAPEQLRALLSQDMYTEYYMTGTLHRFAQFCSLRLQPDVQQETQDAARQIASALSAAYPAWAETYGITALLT